MPDPDALLAAITHARAGRHLEAERILHALLEAEPDEPFALFLLGECALAMERPAEAVGLLSRALALRPAHRDTRLALARAQLAGADPAAVRRHAGAACVGYAARGGAKPARHGAERTRPA